MKLTKIQYYEFPGSDQAWSLENLELGQVNLLVGKNASGKTRTLNLIGGLGRTLFNPRVSISSGHYIAHFDDNGSNYKYELNIADKSVVKEELIINNDTVLIRNNNGAGEILYKEIDKKMHFQAPPQMLAASTRRDDIQHPFLKPIYEWASELRHYRFHFETAKTSLIVISHGAPEVDERDQTQVVGLFNRAIKSYGDPFIQAIKEDLAKINYFVDDIFLGSPKGIEVKGIPGPYLTLCVKESDLNTYTDQLAMSDGMFRALTNLIFVNYYKFSGLAGSLLIDDIGEGLDFDRSCRLIKLLREKALETKVQLIMATNDKFVMNLIPLEEWSVLVRNGCSVSVKNYKNSKEAFDEFKFTGLSNFSFLEMDVLGEYEKERSTQ